mgnify:CR=1 FL=1
MIAIDEIIVIRAVDSDGSVFQAVMEALHKRNVQAAINIATASPFVLTIGEIEIRPAYRQVFKAGKEIRLNHGEYAILFCMARSPGRIFTREELYAAAWGEEYIYGSTTVENTIWRLRKKLEDDPKHPTYIKTVIRTGYKMEKPAKQC